MKNVIIYEINILIQSKNMFKVVLNRLKTVKIGREPRADSTEKFLLFQFANVLSHTTCTSQLVVAIIPLKS